MYSYKEQRASVFTEEGQTRFLVIRDHAVRLLRASGAVTCEKLLVASADTWLQMACVDRLVELKELEEVVQDKRYSWQDRVFIAGVSSPVRREARS